MNPLKRPTLLAILVGSIGLTGCLGSSNDSDDPDPRPQQVRINQGFFTIDESALPFDALAPVAPYTTTSRWSGVLDGAAYRVEVPENWNGYLVMWAHGYRGTGAALTVDNPPMRQYLIDNGYAWAASSYSTNFYDVRAGVEDTNALALAFTDIAAKNGRTLAEPTKYYITGASMGGHVTAAAVERETLDTANNVVEYSAAAPFCGVVGDTELFNYFGGYNLSLFALAGEPADSFPVAPADAAAKVAAARAALWVDYDANPNANGLTAEGLGLYQTLKNLSGGERPIYPLSFGGFQDLLQSFAGSDGTVDGIFQESVINTEGLTYRFQTELGQPQTTDEINFNAAILKADADVDSVNALRSDGLRWVPKVNGEFDVPVLTAHTIGDLFVPILMEQVYRQRAEDQGSADNLVQRAIRAPGHCDFTMTEWTQTLADLLTWEQTGVKPGGDDWLTPATVADPAFGCTYTNNAGEIPGNVERSLMPPCPAPL
ncbi:alpha/beta hydrolase [Halopseudomonas pachastrellae]|jgi:dienelactone hydrolase|nr:alpha/beta hydrolase [Halopseudomonas pachastrellae]